MKLADLICVAALTVSASAYAANSEDTLVNVGRDLVAAKVCGTDTALVARAQAAFDQVIRSDAFKDREGSLRQKIGADPLQTDKYECQVIPSLLGNHLSILSSLTAPDAPPKPPIRRRALIAAEVGAAAVFVLLFMALLEVYLAPYLTALILRKPKRDAILMVNIFLGWTVVGWIMALIWAVEEDKATTKEQPFASPGRDRLTRLSSLLASGDLTAEEFDILQARLVGQPSQ